MGERENIVGFEWELSQYLHPCYLSALILVKGAFLHLKLKEPGPWKRRMGVGREI